MSFVSLHFSLMLAVNIADKRSVLLYALCKKDTNAPLLTTCSHLCDAVVVAGGDLMTKWLCDEDNEGRYGEQMKREFWHIRTRGLKLDPKRRPFFKFHEKIQHKYEEMQRKLAKSKSVDALSNLSEDFDFREKHHCSTIDLRELDDTAEDKETNMQMHTGNAVFQDIRKESNISLAKDYIVVERVRKESENEFFCDRFSQMSLESINEIEADSDCSTNPSTPQKLSIRNRLSVAIEKRKEKKREKENLLKEKEQIAKEITKEKKKESRERIEKFVLSNTTKQDVFRFHKRAKVATVTIALIEATGLTDISEEKPRVLFCRFRLGSEKYKSKYIRSDESVAKWQELFNLNLHDDERMLEVSLSDKDSFIGRSVLDLSELEKEKTHRLRINLEGDVGKAELFILLTISGTSLVNTLIDLDDYEATKRRISNVKKQFAWYHVTNDTGDVGMLSVIVYGAKGLVSNETYCILQLGNERLQTQTESKTNDPNWMKIFSFPVNDITSIMVVTVHDEKRSEDIAKLSIPLLQISNGEKKWYALKDVTQSERAKGNNARILLEMRVTWNILRASVRVISPKEVQHLEMEDRLQRHIFARNLSRARAVVNWIFFAIRTVKTLFEWESRKLNFIALTIWILFCWFFRVWMIPLLLIVPFYWYRPEKYVYIDWKKYLYKELAVEIYDQNKEKDDNTKKEETSWRRKLNSLTDMVQTVQNGIGLFASYGESVKNLFNFTVPFLSCLAIIIITIIAFVMYLVPVKYIFIVWGIHKFARKILRPNRVPNNEILDLLSRVPDDETLLDIQPLPLEEIEEDVIN